MISRIVQRLNATTAVAFAALVMSMAGGAFAFGGSGSRPQAASTLGRHTATAPVVTTSKKKSKGKSTSKVGPRGPAGSQGAAGPAGPAGAKGEAGSAGTPGTAGKEGEKGKNGENGKEGEKGTEGSPWTDGSTLPSKATETGTWIWTFANLLPTGTHVAISFPIRLAAPLSSSHVHFIVGNDEEIVGSHNEFSKVPSEACKGTVENPTATPGNLCVYPREITAPEEEEEGRFTEIHRPEGGSSGAGTVGTLIAFEGSSEGNQGYGTWAVTAE